MAAKGAPSVLSFFGAPDARENGAPRARATTATPLLANLFDLFQQYYSVECGETARFSQKRGNTPRRPQRVALARAAACVAHHFLRRLRERRVALRAVAREGASSA